MRKSLLLYLFVFAILVAVFVYVSGNRRLAAKDREIAELEEQLELSESAIEAASSQRTTGASFSLETNNEALSYLEDRNLDPDEVARQVEDIIISRNRADADNDLVPYEGMEGFFRVNKVKLLNHKWALATFTDGSYWGDLFISYDIGADGSLELNTEKAVLYPRN